MGFIFIFISLILLVVALAVASHFLSKSKRISITGKHVVITGGSKGLGLEFANLCVSKGAKVTMIARDEKDLKKAKEEILKRNKSTPAEHVGIKAGDVTKIEDIKRVINESIQERGDIDWLVCNAGSAKPGMLSEASSSDYNNQIQLNYMGVVNSVLASLDNIKANKNSNKKIICVSSAMGLVGFAGYTAYAPTKWAVRGFCECLRNELLTEKIGVHIFYASNMDTPGYKIENQIKPKVTSLIEGKSKVFSAETSASHLFEGISSEFMHITSEFEIDLLRIRAAGISYTNNFFLDLLLSPFLPFISFFVRMDWDKIVHTQLGKK